MKHCYLGFVISDKLHEKITVWECENEKYLEDLCLELLEAKFSDEDE